MKRQLCSLVLTGLLATGVMLAQEPGSAPEQGAPQADGGGHRGRGFGDPDQRLAHMTKRYNLTADQQSQIKPLLQDEQQQMQALRSDTSTPREDKHAKMQSIHQASTQKIEAVLTDDQKQKFEADQQKFESRRAEHGHGGANGGAPPDGGAPPQ